VKSFYNICRHHAARLLDNQGIKDGSEIQCRYHGWTYEFDGRLRKAPRIGGIENFRPKNFGLYPIPVSKFDRFILLHFGNAEKPDSTQGPPQLLHETQFTEVKRLLDAGNTSKLKFLKTIEYEVNCNWKVFVDNYLDGGYHVPILHTGLSAHLDEDTYKTELFDRYSIQSVTTHKKNVSTTINDFTERLGKSAFYAYIYPNFMINRYGPWMDTNLVLPISHNKTKVIFDYFIDYSDPIVDNQFIDKSFAASHRVQLEDQYICESVQGGLESTPYETGRYAPKVEHAEHHFHKLLKADFDHYFSEN